MASFVPRYSKKHETLNWREELLVWNLLNGVSGQSLLDSANDVRVARVRALKEQLAKLPPAEGPEAEQFHRIEERIRKARLVTIEEILTEFQELAEKQRRRNASAKPGKEN
jgi:hypothetical protein